MSGSWFYLRRIGEERANRAGAEASQPGGNQAFNTCRTVELNQLKVQETDFRVFLNRLCLARTNEEFDRFMAEQGHGGAGFSSEWSGA